MYNKKLLSKIDLGKYKKPNAYSKDIITDPAGQYNHPGKPTRIPSNNITMKGVGYPVLGVADNGQQQLMQPGQDYIFPGAKYVDEFPQMKKGGGLNSKKYTRSLEGIGSLFRESDLFKKPKSKKKKFFHPNAKYFQDGGEPGDKFKKRLMKRYPGMQGVYGAEGENLNIVKDPNYAAADFGYGNIEFMHPGLPEVNYPDKTNPDLIGYTYTNPSPNKYTSVYNPKGANRADIFLDMMHGMRDDSNYETLLQNFDKAVKAARGEDMQYYYEKDVKEKGYKDGQDQWNDNYVDSQLRAQLAPGSIGMFSHGRRDYRKDRRYDSPEMRAAAKDIRNYLKGKYQMGGAACPPGYAKHPLTGECVIINPSDINKMPAGDKRRDTIRSAVFAQDVDQTQQYFRDYYNSPRYREMITNSAGPTAYVYTQTRKNNLETIPSVVNDPKLRDRNALGTSYNATGEIKVDQEKAAYGTMSHEFSHSTDRPSKVYTYPGMNAIYHQNPDGSWFVSSNSTGNIWRPITDPERTAALSSYWQGTTEYDMARVIPPKDVNSMQSKAASSYLNSPYYYRLSPEEKKKYKEKYLNDPQFKKEEVNYLKYVTEPTETRARLNAIRFEGKDTGIYDPFKQKVDSKTYQKLKNQDIKGLNELRLFYTDQEIIEMLNTVSKNQDKQESINQTQMAKKGGFIKKFAPGGVASPKDLDPETMRRYLAALKDQENNIRAGYKGGKWYPHKSPEGGLDTIAYGHKLTSRNSPYYQGITDQQAEQLLQGDVLKHQAIAKKQVDAKYGKGTFDSLPQDRQMLLVDYQYNLGTLSGFPSFVDATVKGDKEKMLKEHVRYGAGKPLKRRNDWTVGVINDMTFPEKFDPNQITVPIANVPDATTVVNPVDPAAMPAPEPAVTPPPPPQFQGGGIVELDGLQFVKNPNGQFTYFDPTRNTIGAPVTDKALMQRLQYEAKPVGAKPVVQGAPGRMSAKELTTAAKAVKPEPIQKAVSRANVSDATSVEQPYIQKPSFLDQPSPAQSLKNVEKARRDYAQSLINQGLAKQLGITAKYLSPANANSANPKTLEQLMLEEIDKKGFEQKLKNAQMSGINKKWNEASTYQKASDVTRSFLADPINVTEEFIWGDQYLPDRANILRDPRNPLNPLYRKETGYDQSSINNMVNMINPFSSAADATVYARQGNLLGTATQFGEGLLKAAVLSRAPGLLNSAMGRRVNLGALGTTDLGTLAGATGVAAGVTALPTTANAWYKYGQTGTKEDLRAAVNQTALNATDFIAPEVLGSKGALSALMKGEKLTPLQQLSRQNIIPGGSISTTGLDNALEMRNALRTYTDSQSQFPSFSGTLPSSSSASNIDDIINRVQQIRLQPAPAPASITRTTPRPTSRTVSAVQTDAELQDALSAANQRIAALPDNSEERRMFEVFASELNSALDARQNYTNALNELEQARRNHVAAGLEETNDLVMQAEANLAMAKENLEIVDPDYLEIDRTSRNLLNQGPQPEPSSTAFDLTRQTPGVTTYAGTTLPATQRANLFEGALSNYNITTEPIEFSEATRTALNSRPPRERGSASLMTYGAQLRAASDPIEFANRLRNMLASGAIDVKAYEEITKNFKNILGKQADAADIFEFESAKMILGTDPKKIYTGSTLSRNEALNELMNIPKDELEEVLIQNYGYSLDDIEFVFNNASNISDKVRKIALNQIIDDYEYVTKYGTLNPNTPSIDFSTRQVVAPQLQNNIDQLAILGVSEKSSDIVKKTAYKGKNPTTGIVRYNDVMEKTIHKIKDKADLLNNKELDEQLEAYEEVYNKLKNVNSIEAKDIRNKLEDLRGTKHLRTVYADELKAAGLSPSEIEKISIISNDEGTKSLVSGDGDVIGSVKFSQTTDGIEISSTGVNYKFHPHHVKHSKIKDWDTAQKELSKRYLDEELSTITNPNDRKNPIVIKASTKKANERAAAHIAQLQINNNNKFGEALYAGLHHGVKNTRGGMYTKQHFIDTDLPDAITQEIITRPRAQNFWHSKIKDFNDQGIPRAAMQQGPLEKYQQDALDIGYDKRPIFWIRKLGGDVSKLSRFIG